MTKKEHFQKIAKKKRYLGSRAYETYNAVASGGLNRLIGRRALQGRKNIGAKGLTKTERENLSKIKNDKSGKTYPISRFLTSPAAAGVVSGLSGAALGAQYSPAAALGTGLLYAGAGAGGSALHRALTARAMKGRAGEGRKVVGKKTNKMLEQIRKANKKK